MIRKSLLSLIFLLGLSQLSTAQKRYLQPGDPLIGNWKFNADSSGHKTKAPILAGEEVLSILPGLEVCMMAKSFDSQTGHYHTATYFTVRKDATKMYGEVTESDNPQWAGKLFSFVYDYHKGSDILVVIIGLKKYYYSRMD